MISDVFSESYKLPLYSKLIDWLENCPQKSASCTQWDGMLNNLQSVRKEEIERSGLYKSLFTQPDHYGNLPLPLFEKLSKEQLLAIAKPWLGKCFPTIHSHWKHTFLPTLNVKTEPEKRPARVEPRARPFVEKAQTCYQHPSLGFWIIRTGYEDLATGAPNWIVLDHKGKMVRSHPKHRGWFPTAVEAFDEMHSVIRSRFADFGKQHHSTRFDQYTFLGGNNYQEWFVCLPEWPDSYTDSHFDLEQLLIHIRTTERVDHDGTPLMMVEEIQSPWHADFRTFTRMLEAGEIDEDDEDAPNIPEAPFGKEWHELALKAVIWLAVKQGHERIGFTTGKQQCDRWGQLDGLMNLYDLDVPKTLKRIATKYECDNSWEVIVTRKPEGKIRYDRNTGWVVKNLKDQPITPPLINKDVALHFLSQRSNLVKESVRVLQISPKLKKTMIEGEVPLFGW